MRIFTALVAVLLSSGCTAVAPLREGCDRRVLNEAAAEGLEIASISMRTVYGGRDNNHFQGYRAELKTADGHGYGAWTNRSCTHIRIWRD